MARAKPHLNIVFVGHVDHGKSTTVGRLLFDAGTVDEQTMRKLQEKAKELGKAGFEFAFVMDSLKEEQERGITIDLSHKKFSTQKYDFTIIDAPGHRDFIKNMITGASQADAAVLVVGSEGVQAQTREHALLCKTLGVQQLIIACNKQDLNNYDQAKFEAQKKQAQDMCKGYGWKLDEVQVIPIASFPGENVVKKLGKMPWYTGATLLEALDNLKAPVKPTNLPLRLPIQDVYNITGIGVVPVGKVETGILKVGQKIIFMPGPTGSGVTGEVKTVEMHHEQFQEAEPGDNVGFNVRGVEKKDIARGDVVGPADSPPTVATEFTAQLIIMNHPTVVTVGYTPVFHIHTAQVACQITEITKKLNPMTGEVMAENPDFVKNGDACIVKIRPIQPLCIEKVKEFPPLGRFAVRDSGNTVAVGMCIDLVKK
jgi:elongation factor 1-alpha